MHGRLVESILIDCLYTPGGFQGKRAGAVDRVGERNTLW